ncbi:MAG: SAM-dependent chlorinase/fluorinase [Patescibacteria group bacterium]
MNKKPLITFTSDFGVQSQGVGMMEGAAFNINPEIKVIHLAHGIPDFDIITGARILETVFYLPVGFHVCVVDPGVGGKRKCLAIKVKRGDYLIGPDNGVLIPAARRLGGVEKVAELQNKKYMAPCVSPIFHGRDIFAPAAAWLSRGVKLEELGPILDRQALAAAPYEEATAKGNIIEARIISVNKFGSIHLNITHQLWGEWKLNFQDVVQLEFGECKLRLLVVNVFGDVMVGEPLIMKDDYGRIQVSINQGSFADEYPIEIGQKVLVKKLK